MWRSFSYISRGIRFGMFWHLLHLTLWMSSANIAEFLHSDRTVSLLSCLHHAAATHMVDATNAVKKKRCRKSETDGDGPGFSSGIMRL